MENKVKFNSETTQPPYSPEDYLKMILAKMDETERLRKIDHDNSTKLSIENKDELKKVSVEGFESLQKLNVKLLDEITELKRLNSDLKVELSRYTPDKIAKVLGFSFFGFFALSIFFTVFMDYELVKLGWAKIGLTISIVFIILGLLVGKMFKINLNAGNH